MSYSAYGGYVYRNGIFQPDRSDVFFRDGVMVSTPGRWPGWTHPELFTPGNRPTAYHVVLGDGPYVALFKGGIVDPLQADGTEFADSPCPVFDHEGQAVPGGHLELTAWEEGLDPDDPNADGEFGVMARYVQNGVVWTAFCGWNVGAGYDASDRTAAAIDRLQARWPPPEIP